MKPFIIKCQTCGQEIDVGNHDAQTAAETHCAACGSWSHNSGDCKEVKDGPIPYCTACGEYGHKAKSCLEVRRNPEAYNKPSDFQSGVKEGIEKLSTTTAIKSDPSCETFDWKQAMILVGQGEKVQGKCRLDQKWDDMPTTGNIVFWDNWDYRRTLKPKVEHEKTIWIAVYNKSFSESGLCFQIYDSKDAAYRFNKLCANNIAIIPVTIKYHEGQGL